MKVLFHAALKAKSPANKKGFSIIEILVAVGLLAILTSISIPSFNKYLRSSRTAEAKSSLGQIYIAEKAFFITHRFYTPDLLTVGVAPNGEMLYNAGFASGAAKPSTYTSDIDPDKDDFFYTLWR